MSDPILFRNYNRIILVGSAGSGKSWLSKRIAEITGYKLTHLDNEFWQPGWMQTPKASWLLKQEALICQAQWIIDGNYSGTLALRFAAADLAIFLDISRLVCIWRAIRRTGKKRSDLPVFLEEPVTLSKDFFEFCKWIWLYQKTGRPKIMELHQQYPETAFLHIVSRREVKALLEANR